MALGDHRMSEMEKHFPSNASSIYSQHSVLKVDGKSVNSSSSNASYSPSSCRGRALSREDSTSAESGDDLFSVYSPLQDSEASDDDKMPSPRSANIDAASCVYSIMFLFQVRAACCKQVVANAFPTKNALGYSTEPVSEDVPAARAPSHYIPISRPAGKSNKAAPKKKKSKQKQATKAQASGSTLEPTGPKPSLPASATDSWVANQRSKAIDADEDAKVIRAARSILNKLTIEKFESLFHQLVSCGIKTPHHITTLMCEVFEKATTQHQFIPMYAELCVRLEKDPHIVSAVEGAGYMHNFRRLLLNQCQSVFEQLLEPCVEESVIAEEVQMQRKQQALGNIKLIGELIVQGMLSSDLFVECANQLLEGRATCPEALESLAALMMVAGPKFDSKDWQHYSRLEDIFADMNELTKDKSTPPRVRFLLRDVLDVRSAGWCTSANQAALKAAPMKLDQVREKAAKEQGVASPQRGLQRLVEICRRPSGGSAARSAGDAHVRTPLALKARKQTSKPADIKVAENPSDDSGLEEVHRSIEASCENSSPVPLTPAIGSAFDLVAFRRTLAATLATLASEKNVPAAVQCIRLQEVPVEFQADQFVDILSRIVEERRGAVRRCEFAFAAGLMQGDYSPFEQKTCFDGIALFFQDVYVEMCREVQRLPAIIKSELLPTLYAVFPTEELNEILPEEMRA